MGSIIDRMSGTINMDVSDPKVQYVVEALKKDKVVIFSKTTCPYCIMAKEQFEKLHYPFCSIELDKRDDGNDIQDILLKMTGARTVPRVFIDGKCIGGGTDVKKMFDNGQLKKALEL